MKKLTLEQKWDIIDKIVRKTVSYGIYQHTIKDAIGELAVKPLTGIPIAIAVLYGFWSLFTSISSFITDGFMVKIFDGYWLPWLQKNFPGKPGDWLYSLMVDVGHKENGILVNSDNCLEAFGVLTSGLFVSIGIVLPAIFVFYLIITILEDSGYLPRLAVLLDNIMHKIGLHGHAIVPTILGFGCNVPAIYATRVIPEESDRLVAILTNPLMLCGARLVFFSAIAAAFFGAYAGDILFSLYALGVALAFMVAIILRKAFFRRETSPFVLELPAYQKPSFKVAAVRMWDRGSMYLRKALGVILIGLLIIGILTATDAETLTFTTDPERSLVAALGKSLAPIFTPLNWDWRLIVAMIFGFVAKEIVLGASAMLYGAGEEEIASKLASLYNPIDMYGYMTFILIYIPCIVTIAAIKQETGSWKWTIFAVIYGLILAYIVNLLIVTLGHLLLG